MSGPQLGSTLHKGMNTSSMTASAHNVAQQAQLLEAEGTAWKAVKDANVEVRCARCGHLERAVCVCVAGWRAQCWTGRGALGAVW